MRIIEPMARNQQDNRGTSRQLSDKLWEATLSHIKHFKELR